MRAEHESTYQAASGAGRCLQKRTFNGTEGRRAWQRFCCDVRVWQNQGDGRGCVASDFTPFCEKAHILLTVLCPPPQNARDVVNQEVNAPVPGT